VFVYFLFERKEGTMCKFLVAPAAGYTAMATSLTLALIVWSGTPAMAAEKEKKPAVAVECTAPCIDGTEIEDGAVGSADLATDSVAADEIATGAVRSDEIQDGSIGLGDLGFDPATQAELDNTDTLDDLSCAEGEVAKMVSGAWTCAPDDDSTSDVGLMMAKIDNLAHLRTRGAAAYAFVTSSRYSGDLVSGAMAVDPSFTGSGVEAADFICQDHADAAGLPGLFRAWISDGTSPTAPSSRFTKAPAFAEYVLPPGASTAALWQVAGSYGDLTVCVAKQCLDHAISVDEYGDDVPTDPDGWTPGWASVWTTADRHGDAYVSAPCDHWTTGNSSSDAIVGNAMAKNISWTEGAAERPFQECSYTSRLYCFGQ
jgi:hypothetical protein